MDVSRGLLLPDVKQPGDGLLKTLSIYWDELVVPDYLERAVGPGGTEFIELSNTFEELEAAGILHRWSRKIELPPTDSSELPDRLRPGLQGRVDPANLEQIERIMKLIVLPVVEKIPGLDQYDRDELKGYLAENPGVARSAAENMFNSISAYAAEHYLGRMQDAFELATQHHLAPLAQSSISHVASIVGAPTEAPRSEAALLSAAVQAFELDPETLLNEFFSFGIGTKPPWADFVPAL